MYKRYYNLTERPFQISPDPRFLWLGHEHRGALDFLKYGLLNKLGFLVLTGDVGTGKTTLINTLIRDLDENVVVARISNPKMDIFEFFGSVAKCFGIREIFLDKSEFVHTFSACLFELNKNKKNALLIIDESQNLSDDLLEEIRLFSNIEKPEAKLLNIMFVGQSEFNNNLLKEKNRALRRRIIISHHIGPLSRNETGQYIEYRLKIAGVEKKIFTQGAIDKIYSFSKGNPRLINIISDQALLAGYANNLRTISPGIIKECSQEFRLPGELRRGKAERVSIRQLGSLARKLAYISMVLLLVFLAYLWGATHFNGALGVIDKIYRQLGGSYQVSLADTNLPQTEPLELPADTPSKIIPQKVEQYDQTKSSSPASPVSMGGELLAGDEAIGHPSAVSTGGELLAGEEGIGHPDAGGQLFDRDDFNLNIYFRFNTNEISEKGYETLDQLALEMLRDPGTEIVVYGHTDTLGKYNYNKSLSEFRANIVKSYLVGKGINSGRIKAVGMGSEDPIAPNTDANGRRMNRRVEIRLSDSKEG